MNWLVVVNEPNYLLSYFYCSLKHSKRKIDNNYGNFETIFCWKNSFFLNKAFNVSFSYQTRDEC